MEKNIIKTRLVEAARVAKSNPGFTIEILVDGVMVSYAWGTLARGPRRVDKFITWLEVESTDFNPLIPVFTSLTKIAASVQ